MLERDVSRDLFDSHQLLTQWPLEAEKLRIAFTVYAGMRKQGWEHINIDKVMFTEKDIRDKLIPVLKNSEAPDSPKTTRIWASKLVDECKMALKIVLPFQRNEVEFLDCIHRHHEIRPELLTDDDVLCQRIKKHPLLKWRTQQGR